MDVEVKTDTDIALISVWGGVPEALHSSTSEDTGEGDNPVVRIDLSKLPKDVKSILVELTP